ncbi:Uncharacterised protein [Salmonella enterica subsp. enterica serovar Typhi]|nr:Uncharacterised protein [Salmonella enterica subsp. enterica serovar Typhi]CQU05958.1 Uncharacterised protein [Salmonella enterica subsp. enterica serovar Typhi]CQU15619.1 Uncharacterised protein [Salmonella enterica subsp. enterica serovar Typhi]CQW18626.1 Uncharacterised protein [Salmonella enterica subsp. enterica serovar Typhi]CQW20134.1 Uncharacterised protein [Salmonella enterica subsp. enterica serovar Typhi]
MSGSINTTLNEHASIAKKLLTQTTHALPGLVEGLRIGAARQANTAAARGTFQHHRIANFCRRILRFFQRVEQPGARRHRNARLCSQFARPVFQPELTNLLCSWPDKDNAGLFTGCCKRKALGQKSVARPDSLSAGFTRCINNFIDTQITVAGLLAAERYSNIGLFNMFGVFISIGIDRHAFNPQTLQRADGATGDLAPVGNQYSIKHACSPGWQSSYASLCIQ